MTSSLIPEKPLLVYPSLAATVGLEEATMLSILADLTERLPGTSNNGFTWYSLYRDMVEKAMPFWSPQDVQRVSTNLRDKGIIIIASAPYSAYGELKFAFNEKAQRPQADQHQQPAVPTPARTAANQQAYAGSELSAQKKFIAPHWQPAPEVLAQLAQHNIPAHFAHEQVPEFVTYWRERGEPMRSWGAKFLRHVIHKWRNFENVQVQKEQEVAMSRNWRPSEDAMDILTRQAGVSRNFAEDAIPEFILYWQERGDVLRTWNTKFVNHVRNQWLRYKSALEHDTEPRRIARNWSPSPEVYDVLRMANIDIQFAQEQVPEFVLYWHDSNQLRVSWNQQFLRHVKYQWAKQHALSNSDDSRSTRDLSLEEQLNDRSWAS